jgi:hypothetical protein
LSNVPTPLGTAGPRVVAGVEPAAGGADVRFVDGSTLFVPRDWSGRITDLIPQGALAQKMCVSYTRLTALADPLPASYASDRCREIQNARVNDAFYRLEPHMMRRYTALAFDNIRRDPAGFFRACVYRVFRLFIVEGTSDSWTTQQFEGGGRVYQLARAASVSYLLLAIAGAVIAWRQRSHLWLILTPIVYVPITICYVLTNMRYSVTIQPLVFALMAVVLTSTAGRWRRTRAREAAETARS